MLHLIYPIKVSIWGGMRLAGTADVALRDVMGITDTGLCRFLPCTQPRLVIN